MFKCTFYILATIAGFYTQRDSIILPPALGGKGSLENMYRDYPYQKNFDGFKYYYMVTLGFHVYSALKHILTTTRTHDFMEVLCHHLVTLYLYSFSYMMNCAIGPVISFLHDFSDVLVTSTRAISETKFKTATGIFAIVMFVQWVYTRCYLLGYIIHSITTIPVYMGNPLPKYIFIFLLVILWILQIYWCVLIFKLILGFIFYNKTEDST